MDWRDGMNYPEAIFVSLLHRWLNRICVDCTFLWLIKDLRAAASWE